MCLHGRIARARLAWRPSCRTRGGVAAEPTPHRPRRGLGTGFRFVPWGVAACVPGGWGPVADDGFPQLVVFCLGCVSATANAIVWVQLGCGARRVRGG